ncbi:MAG: hypothetical protein M1838_002911 [Thelocarpon superellum]|nr:MAG: hypothetical protein M1838_002911 [Thelocarpon superellum]
MPVRYTPDELLRLKASPLVRKPENLPPPEEWIGSPPPQVGARSSLARGKPDEIVPLQEPSSRRPTLLDTKHISRSSIPDDIVLGPPKMSFASATAFRASSKTAGPAETSSFAMLDHDPSRPSRLTARDKLSREKDRPDRETDRAWETRTVGLNGKRAPREREREDADGWTSVKARKSFGHEDGERYTRKPLDRDRDRGVESGREPRERGVRAYDPLTRERQPEADREAAPRRNGVPRGRNEASWFKEKESAPPKERPTRESTGREWREADRTTDHAWGRTTKLEKDPEWMDAPGADESKQVHTAEDFQRWKERMRAGGTPSEEKSKPEEDVTVERGASRHASTSSKPDVKPVAPLVMDSGIDKFFGLWNEPKSTHTESSVEAPEPVSRKDAAKANVGRASRFTSFFSPAEETPAPHMEAPPELTSPPAPHKDASNEDREGFQRILQMLGGTSLDTAKATPYPDQGRHPRQMSNENVHPQAPPNHLPAGMRHRGDSHVAPHQSEAVDLRARSSANMESMHGMAPPESGAARNRDNEFFLGLMHHQRPNPAEDMPAPSARGNPQNWMREPSGEGPDGKGL